MTEIVDIHCHILPGLDDGVSTSREALEVLWEAQRQNIKGIFLTPHYYPGMYEVTADQIRRGMDVLRKICQYQNIEIELYSGQECFYHTDLVEKLNRGEVLTLADSRYVLVEFDPGSPFSLILGGIRQLQSNGYVPVLAHFERYAALRTRDRLLQIRELDVLLQMNFDTLLKKDGLFHKNPWRSLVKEGLVDCLGSDCHGIDFRPLRTDKAVQWMESQVDPQIRERILKLNIEKILMNR